jgi:hypothetical protein
MSALLQPDGCNKADMSGAPHPSFADPRGA